MSSRIGLWLRSSRSVSPRVPTVEYARSERSSAKSSQAAWNSALSAARSSGLGRRQAGSTLKKVNLTNVRAAKRRRLVAAWLVAGVLACAGAAPARATPSVIVALLPPDTTVADLSRIEGMSLGVMSTGIGHVPATQTYLDISQGNRVSQALYDHPLPSEHDLQPLTDFHAKVVPVWGGILTRADSAPANIQPGLLAATLEAARVRVRVERRIEDPAFVAADGSGRVDWLRPRYLPCRRQPCVGMTLLGETLHNTRKLVG